MCLESLGVQGGDPVLLRCRPLQAQLLTAAQCITSLVHRMFYNVLLHMPQLLLDFRAFGALCAAPNANSTWGICSNLVLPAGSAGTCKAQLSLRCCSLATALPQHAADVLQMTSHMSHL